MATDTPQTRDRTEFGQRLFTARRHASLTQAQLAARVGMSQSNIAFLEKEGNASEKTVELAHECGVRAAWLARGEGPMTGPETALDAARVVAEQHPPEYLAPNSAKDYRTIVHTLAESLEGSGVNLSIKQFVELADEVFRKLGNG